MKKVILATAILGCSLLTSCGFGTTDGTTASSTSGTDVLSSVLGSVVTGSSSSSTDVLSGIIGSIIGTSASQSSLVGTWSYSSPCVQFESESLLAKAGGSVISSKVESTLATYYQKIGIKQGACQFVFGSDKSLKMVIGGKSYTGTYSFDSSNNTVTMTGQFGNNLTAYVSMSGSNLGLTFDASKFLTLLTNYSASSSNSQLSSIGTLAKNYNGMKLGFKFAK